MALVTGGSRGIGRSIALRLALDGADCAITYHTRAGLADEVVAKIEALVASATATAFRPVLEQKPHNVSKTFAISVASFVAAVQRAAPLMKDGGRIVVVSGLVPPATVESA